MAASWLALSSGSSSATSAAPVETMLTPSGLVNKYIDNVQKLNYPTQVLSSEQGGDLQLWSESAAAENPEERCWELFQPQVLNLVSIQSIKMVVGVELLVLRTSCEVLVKWSDLDSSRLVCPPLHSALRKEESALSQVLCLILCSDEKIGTSISRRACWRLRRGGSAPSTTLLLLAFIPTPLEAPMPMYMMGMGKHMNMGEPSSLLPTHAAPTLLHQTLVTSTSTVQVWSVDPPNGSVYRCHDLVPDRSAASPWVKSGLAKSWAPHGASAVPASHAGGHLASKMGSYQAAPGGEGLEDVGKLLAELRLGTTAMEMWFAAFCKMILHCKT